MSTHHITDDPNKHVHKVWQKNNCRSCKYNRWMSSDSCDTCFTIPRLCTKAYSQLCLYGTMCLLYSGKSVHIHWIALRMVNFIRYLEVKFGRWKDLVCAARSLVKEKLQFHCSALKRNREIVNLWRFVGFFSCKQGVIWQTQEGR